MKQKIIDFYTNHKKLTLIIITLLILLIAFWKPLNNFLLKDLNFFGNNIGSSYGDGNDSLSDNDDKACEEDLEAVRFQAAAAYSYAFDDLHKDPNPELIPEGVIDFGGINRAEEYIRKKLEEASDDKIEELCKTSLKIIENPGPSSDEKEFFYSELIRLGIIDSAITCVLLEQNKFTKNVPLYSNVTVQVVDSAPITFNYSASSLGVPLKTSSAGYDGLTLKINLYECFANNGIGQVEPVDKIVLDRFVYVKPFLTIKNDWTSENSLMVVPGRQYIDEMDNLQHPVGQFIKFPTLEDFKKYFQSEIYYLPVDTEFLVVDNSTAQTISERPSSGGGSGGSSLGSVNTNNGNNISTINREYSMAEISETISSAQRDLDFGITGQDVKLLQKFLNANDFMVNPIAGQPGSVGYETDYFGNLTKSALIRFQKANNIVPSFGYFGPITRDVIKNKY